MFARLAVVFAAALVALVLGLIGARGPVSAPAVLCGDDETKERVRALLLEAVDEALKNHVMRMHEVWMKDDTGQPARAINGAQQGVRAYVAGRARALKFDMPSC